MAKKFAPHTKRNRDPILAVLRQVLPPRGTVLEVAAGTGEQAVYFAPALAPRVWLASDADAENVASIAAWQAECRAGNLHPPVLLDVTQTPWPVEADPPEPPVTAIVAINLVHIAPWEVTEGLTAGAGRILPAGGVLYLYGPYKVAGCHTAPSNEAFDRSLKARDPRWGVRDVAEVAEAAASAGLDLVRTAPMPANNLSLVFEKR